MFALTGSISNVGTEDLKSMPVSSVTNALGGRIPGLVTRQESGRPGGDQATMFIRGRASLNDSSPLVLIDGVERPMAQIDPDDIETISVLKDASAFCVWDIRLKEVIPNSDEKDIRVSPSRPLRVVTNITPFAPRTPYTAVAEASFNTKCRVRFKIHA